MATFKFTTVWLICASYDAAEDNEISFKEGDRITSIEKVDEDWWQGTVNGKTGLFPCERAVEL